MTNEYVLAGEKVSYDDGYGFRNVTKLIEHKGKHYVFADHWSGNDIEGQCPRTFVYEIPPERLPEIRGYLSEPALAVDDQGFSDWQWFENEVLPSLKCLGRQDRLRWASKLQ